MSTTFKSVPVNIPRPEYVGKKAPSVYKGSDVQTSEVIEKMRIAGTIAADAMHLAGSQIKDGMTTEDLDVIVHEYICDQGAYPSTLGYRGFPKSLCTSINEVICHGIPSNQIIREGDIVNLDVTAFKNGVHGDTNYTFLAGEVKEEVKLLVERTKEALDRAIQAVIPGRPINVIGRVIESYAKRFNYGVVRDFTGHDTWTVLTKDRKMSAQFEHTLVVTKTGADILTLPSI
jgi:methionyl aminopeptidase